MIIKLKNKSKDNIQKKDTEIIRGLVKYLFYPKDGLSKNCDLTFCGFTLVVSGGTKIKCFGMAHYIEQGDYFELEGYYQEDGSFKFKIMRRVDDDEIGALSMLKFLFGAKTALLIENHFENPMNAMNLFKADYDGFCFKALNIKGIGIKKLEKARNKYENNRAIDVLYQSFSAYKMSMNQAMKIFKKWGSKSMEIIQENPYRIYNIENCCSWNTVDGIALKHFGLEKTDKRRMAAGLLAEMNINNSAGNDYILYDELVKEASKRLSVDTSYIGEALLQLIEKKRLVLIKDRGIDIVYLPHMYKAEVNVANLCKKFITNRTPSQGQLNKIEDFIKSYENKKGFSLAQKQKDAIKNSLTNRLSIISGPPGSGKTTIIDAICEFYSNKKILLAAPSAKAADRMYKSTGLHSSTIHRLLKTEPDTKSFFYNANNPLPADVLIIDEVSMLGILLANNLLSAVPENIKALILVGDADQLPSVDAGNVLTDMLASKIIPATILDEIYRQGDGSVALTRAMDFKNNKGLDTTASKDFIFYEESNISKIQENVVDIFMKDIERYGLENVMILSPQNVGELGVNKINELIQERVNSKVWDKTPEIRSGTRKFRIGDRVLHTQNEDSRGIYNGYVGTITDIIEGDKDFGTMDTIVVQYDDIEETYTRDRFDNIKLAYALTVHKSQGSEYKSVIFITHSAHHYMLSIPLVYTGMTRVKNVLHMVGEKNALNNSSKTKIKPRNSKLKEFLEQ